MFELDTLRLIRKTSRRFISLLLIVLIGAGFMMGLFSCRQIMEESVDIYYDEYEFSDFQLYSQYGFSDDDYIALKQTDEVSQVFASKTIDMLAKNGPDDEYVTRVTEDYRVLNKYKLVEGRAPRKADECVVIVNDYMDALPLGSVITLDYGENEVSDYLKNDKFTIVGFAESPEFMAKVKGPSNYLNMDLDMIIYIPNENFLSDYYTTVYLNVEGGSDYVSLSKAYSNYIQEKQVIVEDVASSRQHITRDEIIGKVEKQLEDSQNTLNELKEITQKELDDSKKQLDDANITLITYETQLNMLSSTIRTLENSIAQNGYPFQEQIDEYNDFMESIGLNPGYFYENYVHDSAQEMLDNAYSQYNSMLGQLASARRQYEEGMEEYTEGLAKFNDEVAKAELEIRKAKQELDELPAAKWMIFRRDANYSAYMYEGNTKQMGAIGKVLPMLFYLVAALVCLTTMKRLIDEQRGQIGIFVALGFSDGRIIFKYVSYALMASLIGSIIGILIGQPLFSGVIYWAWRMMYLLPPVHMHYPVRYIIISILAFALLMALVTAYVVKDTIKEVPAALMRPKAPKKAKEIMLEKIPFIWNRLSFTSKITARNIFRYKSRFFMTIIGIAGCTGLLLLGFSIKDSVADVVNVQYGQIFKADYDIAFKDVDNDKIAEYADEIGKDLQYELVEPYMEYSTKVYFSDKDGTAVVRVLDPRTYTNVVELFETDGKNNLKLDNTGVIISEKFAKNNNLKVGDSIRLESVDGIKADAAITGICQMYFQHYVFMSQTFYETAFEEDVHRNHISVTGGNSADLLKICEKFPEYSSLYDTVDFKEQFDILVGALNLIIYVIIITAGSLAFVVLINLTQVNISERIREIATLKVLGFNDKEVALYIFKEIILLTIIGALLGMPLGVLENRLIMGELNMEMIMFAKTVKPMSYVYSFAITLIFTLIVMFAMRKTLRDVNMVESLKSVE